MVAFCPSARRSVGLGENKSDRGYDARAIVDLVESRGGRAHIPTSRDRKVQRSVDHALYRQRNLIERFFNKLKHFRRIATRYDKTARNFLAAVLLAATHLWARFESATWPTLFARQAGLHPRLCPARSSEWPAERVTAAVPGGAAAGPPRWSWPE